MSEDKKTEEDILEKKTEEDVMDVVHASATEIVVKGKDIKELVDKKAVAKKLTKEEELKIVEDNIIGEFND